MNNMEKGKPSVVEQLNVLSRKEKRKAFKKDKRKQIRKDLAEKARVEEEAWLNDPEEQRKIQLAEEREKERLERERKEFEERERIFLEELERKKQEEEEEERKNVVKREVNSNKAADECLDEDDEGEYIEEGPPEIIWQGNEIIVKKNKVRVKKKDVNHYTEKEDSNRPTSNPLPPQSEAYAAYKNELPNNVDQQVPNFGTEKDKAHCPFHIKTGACRFGLRCNRVHYYPDKSTTLLIKNMYNGPGLAWEQDEGLEYTDEEVERSYEEFYEDVHTEFLKFGEIINFKVCRNGSFHLRGNVYIHYKFLDSALMAYKSVHGRYFAGKQVKCEFVSLTRWKVAICGENMKSRLKTCSRGSACNFLHCFSNPGGDYEWANSDKPPPRYWVKKMTALFGYSDDFWHDKQIEQPSPKDQQNSSMIFTLDADSYENKRHQSMGTYQDNGDSSRNHHEGNHVRKSRRNEHKKDDKFYEDEIEYNKTDSDGDQLDRNTRRRHHNGSENHSRHIRRVSRSQDYYGRSRTHGISSDEDLYTEGRRGFMKRRSRHRKNASVSSNDEESDDAKHKQQVVHESRRGYTKRRSRRRKSVSVSFSSSDEDIYTERRRGHMKRRSQHRKSVSVSSNDEESDDAKHKQQDERWQPSSDPSEAELQRNKNHQRSRRHVRDKGVDERDNSESENEPFSKKQKIHNKKSATEKNVELHDQNRQERSRSRDSGHLSDKKRQC